VKTTLTELFATKTRKEWIAEASEYDICLSPIQSIQEVVDDSNLQSRKMFRTHTHSVYGSITTINQPLKFSNIELSEGWAPPLLGEDTNAILSELGYSLDQIEDLKTKGIL
jgi:succinate--hydroxymethylglutarate CoA-transferase